jgi:predicted MFS family arabinose efflux permease
MQEREGSQTERGQAKLLLTLCMCAVASSISWRALDPMLPVMARDLGVSLDTAVLLSTAYSLPFATMQLVFGPIGDAWGKSRLLRLSLAVVAAALFAIAIAPSFYTVLAARIVSGAFAGGINPVSIALIGEKVPYAQRQVTLGRFLVAMISGQMIGASAAGLLVELIGWRWVVALAALFVAIVFASSMVLLGQRREARSPDGHSAARSRPSLAGVLRSYRAIVMQPGVRLVMGTLVCEGILVLGLIPFVAGMLLQRSAGTSAQAGIVIGCFAIGGMCFGFLVRHFVQRLGPWHMMRLGGTLAGAGLIGAALPMHWSATAACFFAVGFGFYMVHNCVMLRVTELAPHARGAGVAVGAFSFSTGQGFGPVAWAAFAATMSYAQMFVVAGVLTVALGFVAATLLSRRFRPPD